MRHPVASTALRGRRPGRARAAAHRRAALAPELARLSCGGDRAATPRRRAGASRPPPEPPRRRRRQFRPAASWSSGSRADAPARLVGPDESIHVDGAGRRFVSRGGEKLAAALERFRLDVTGTPVPRRRRVDGRLHRLPPAGGRGARRRGRRRAGPARVVAPHRSARHGDGAHQRARAHCRRHRRCRRPGGRRPLLHLAAHGRAGAGARARRPTPTWCCWSSRSSRPVGPGSARAGSSVTRRCTARCSREVRDGLDRLGLHTVGALDVAAAGRRRQRGVPLPRRPADAGRAVSTTPRSTRWSPPPMGRGSRGAPVSVRRVGLVPHRERGEAAELAKHAAEWLAEHGVAVRVPAQDAEASGLSHLATAREDFADGLDVVISLGGDGTMLRTVDLVYEAGVPVLGVNVGQLGYLAEVEPPDLDAALGGPGRGRLPRSTSGWCSRSTSRRRAPPAVVGSRSTRRCSRSCTRAAWCASRSRSTAPSSRPTRRTV